MTLLIVRLPKGKGRRSRSMQIKRANSVNQNGIFRIQPRLAGPFVDAGNCGVIEAGSIRSVYHRRAVHFVMAEEGRLCLSRIVPKLLSVGNYKSVKLDTFQYCSSRLVPEGASPFTSMSAIYNFISAISAR
jgi:hypothetical protein